MGGEKKKGSILKMSILQMRATHAVRIFSQLKEHKEETNCTGNEYLMTTTFFTLWQ